MNNEEIIQKVLDSIWNSRENNTGYDLIFSGKSKDDHKHEFLFFIKPEITTLTDRGNLSAILNMTLHKISQFRLSIQDSRLLTSSYLSKYDIIAQHYGVINALSRLPLQYLSSEAKSKFREIYGRSPEETRLLGSLQFLQNHTFLSADDLELIWKNSQSVKLAGGTYCARIKFQGEDIYLINGFHPNQLTHFTAPGRCIIAFTLTGDLDWSIARNQFIGKTNPADALKGSLRNELLVGRQSFGLQDVSSGMNGFHLSAGPVEGLVELMRYCSNFAAGERKKLADFVFGRELNANFTEEETERICSNQTVLYKGNTISTFDLTEEKNSQDAIHLLKDSKFV